MEPDSRYPLIGALVLALAIAAAAVFAWYSGDHGRDVRNYVIAFDRQSVDGLQVGSQVNTRGVQIGRVERFTIDPGKINRVKVLVSVASDTPVGENTTAVVSRNFLTGLARIDLQTPADPGAALIDAPDGETHPVIAEGTSEMDQVVESANRLALSGEEALTNLNRLMTDENQRAFSEALAATRDLMVGLNGRLASLDQSLASVNGAASAFARTNQRLGALIDDSRGTMVELRGLASSGRGALDETRVAVVEYGRLAQTLEREAREIGPRITAMADGGGLELRATSRELRRAAEAMTQALERLTEPRSALIGPGERELGPGEAR